MKLSPTEFEKLVVKLLLQMGYGSGIDDAGMVTQRSNDGGIDGIIKEDQLGFSNIYIQAKQWAVDQTVGKPEIQKFVGALTGQQAQKGLRSSLQAPCSMLEICWERKLFLWMEER